jgi:hypothetical protein
MRDLPLADKSRKDLRFSVQVARDDARSSDGGTSGGTSPTAVLLAFLDVSLLARGMAEGNRGRGLTVTWVGRVEGGGTVDEGNGIIDVVADLGRLAPGG